jgi:ADP-ribosylglycohydrolase
MLGSHDPTVIDPAPLARSAAVAMFAAGDLQLANGLAADTARVTHQAPFVVDTCRLFACMLTRAIDARDRDDILGLTSEIPGTALKDDVRQVAAGWKQSLVGRRAPPAGLLGCLDKAVRAFAKADDFLSGIEKLLDSPGAYPDATLSVYGALAGAHFGERSIAPELKATVAGIDRLETICDQMFLRNRAVGA